MQLAELKRLQKISSIPPVIIFYSKNYSVYLFKYLKDKFKADSIDLSISSIDQLKGSLEISFLGTSKTYISNFSASSKQTYSSYVDDYSGPNRIIGFVSDKAVFKKQPIIDLDKAEIIEIFDFIGQKINAANLRMFKHYHQRGFAFDQQLLINTYLNLIGPGSGKDLFMEEYFPKLVVPEASLFDLAGALFAKNTELFFDNWIKIKDKFADIFWISFWSDQLFKAACFVNYQKDRDLEQANKASFRLPFSFIQKDWRLWNLGDLTSAHSEIYELDFSLKNGSSDLKLEIIFSKLLAH